MADISQAAQGIADALAPSPSIPAARWRWGTVVNVGEFGTMDVSIGGSTVPGIRAAQHVMGAQAGDRVRVAYYGADAVVDVVRATSEPASSEMFHFETVSSASAAVASGSVVEFIASIPAVSGMTCRGAVQVWTSGTGTTIVGAPWRTSGDSKIHAKARGNVASNVSVSWLLFYTADAYTSVGSEAVGPTTTDVTFTANTANWTPNTTLVKRSGNVVTITITGQAKAGVATWQNETYIIGTLGIQPAARTNINAVAQISSNFTPILCAVKESGEIALRTAGTAVPANTWLWINGTYLI